MPLSKAEYAQRLSAALKLTDKKRDDVDAVLARKPWLLGEEAASRPGRARDNAEPSTPLSRALGEVLGVGEGWFEEPDLLAYLSGASRETGLEEAVAELTRKVVALEAELSASTGRVQKALEDQQQILGRVVRSRATSRT